MYLRQSSVEQVEKNTGSQAYQRNQVELARAYGWPEDLHVSFHLLHVSCGSRLKNRYLCPVCNEVVEREQLVRGYEVANGEYVRFTDAELETIEAEANNNIELKEFIPIEKVDPVCFEGSHYLALDEGGDKAYRLLAEAMEKSGRDALAEMVSHGKEKLVLIGPSKGGLILHTIFQPTRFAISTSSRKPRACVYRRPSSSWQIA